MSDPKYVKTIRGLLKKILTIVVFACLIGIVFPGQGICQNPADGDKPDQWAPYESGQYFEQLQKIASIYQFHDSRIAYLHFESSDTGVGPVELFRIPAGRGPECNERDCYFFVLVAFDHSNAPFVTPCQFTQAALSHLFNPDSSRFYGFEFSCQDTLLRVKVTPSHFMAFSIKKTS